MPSSNKILLGTTYSLPHIKYLELSTEDSFNDLLQLHFDFIRIGTYWNLIEPQKDKFDFSSIDIFLQKADSQNQKLIITIGLKAPRWPEFYAPQWFSAAAKDIKSPYILTYLEKLIIHIQHHTSIQYWQVENEPLDPSGPEKSTVSFSLLEKEVHLLKTLDSRPVILSAWGNGHKVKTNIKSLIHLADEVGIDIYYKQFLKKLHTKSLYTGPIYSDFTLSSFFASLPKPFWITELQAEPWENSMDLYKGTSPVSFNSELFLHNYQRALQLNPKGILFWGFEYWYWLKVHRDSTVWDTMKMLLERNINEQK